MRLLSDLLPLRRGSDITGMAAEAILPWVYGRVTLAPLQMDSQGLLWLIADHPILAVTSVRDDGGEIGGWELVQRVQAPGHAIATVRVTRAPQGTLVADVVGKRHPDSGALLQHPADICADILRASGGSVGAWEALRSAWPGLRLGGVLDALQPVRDAIGGVLASVGAHWSGQPLRAWMPESGEVVATVSAADVDDVSADSSADGLATQLRVAWGRNWASGEPAGTVLLSDDAAVSVYGLMTAESPAPWLTTERDARVLATAVLGRMARPIWKIQLSLGRGDAWRPGDRLIIDHPWMPAGAAEISSITRTSAGRNVVCRLVAR